MDTSCHGAAGAIDLTKGRGAGDDVHTVWEIEFTEQASKFSNRLNYVHFCPLNRVCTFITDAVHVQTAAR
jgi:hypothetical protein